MEMVGIGDPACFMRDCTFVGKNRVTAKALDDRVGCLVLIEAIKALRKSKSKGFPNDLYFVFTVQEEVGLRGARTSAFGIMPDMAIAVDVTSVGDTPECMPLPAKLGGGAAIKVRDAGTVIPRKVKDFLVKVAEQNRISYQFELLIGGATDAAIIQYTQTGVPVGGISIPTRYIHSPSELADLGDIKSCIDLVRWVSLTDISKFGF